MNNLTRIQYNGLTIDSNSQYTISRAEGLTGLPMRTSEQLKTGADGGLFFKNLYGARTIVIEGRIFANTVDDYFDAERELIRAFTKSNDELPLIVRLWDGSEKYINCHVVQTPMIVYAGGNATQARYAIELRASDPYWGDASTITESIFLADSGGLPIKDGTPLPAPLGYNAQNYKVINNTGDVANYAKMTIYGSVTNPAVKVVNSAGTFDFSFASTLNSSERIVIEVINNDLYVTKGGVNWLQYMTGDYPILQTGGNTIQYTASIYDSTTYLEVEFRNKYLNIST
jgi:phage-related protein